MRIRASLLERKRVVGMLLCRAGLEVPVMPAHFWLFLARFKKTCTIKAKRLMPDGQKIPSRPPEAAFLADIDRGLQPARRS